MVKLIASDIAGTLLSYGGDQGVGLRQGHDVPGQVQGLLPGHGGFGEDRSRLLRTGA